MTDQANGMDVESLISNKEANPLDDEEKNVDAIHDIIDYLVRVDNVSFKSQQIGEVDLTTSEKKSIALDIFNKGQLTFLEKFGKHLKLEHLSYFESRDDSNKLHNFEINYRINELKRFLSVEGKKCLIKNRRYEALSKMINGSNYFSEVEMMQRNPLLYEQLVGQYMTESEKKARDNIDTDNITFLNVVLKGIDKQQMKDMLDSQKEAETLNEESQSEEDSQDDNSNPFEAGPRWGEFDNTPIPKKKKSKKKNIEDILITAPERILLKEEFVQEMYRSFLNGEDEDFDYHTVDNNSEYDCLEVCTRDEEEKYFDKESPEETLNEDVADKKTSDMSEISEDELDVYMKHLSKHPTLENTVQMNGV